jgi:hypothetical protein
MITGAARLAIVFAALCLITTSAPAQGIRPECMKMKDKIGCTCALENGGVVVPATRGHGPRWYHRVGANAHINDAFVRCNMSRRGLSPAR